MEKISHRITLDVHKGGIQKVLRGMFTGDVLSRKIVISLVAGSAVCNMDENTTAVMYVTKPSGVTNYGACTVEGNLVTYDILPADIDEPGITQMQLKVVSGEKVLYAPVFSVEAQKNSTSDTPAETSPQFSALEQALAQVEEVYNKRIVSVEVEEDYTFVVTYADGETYTSDAFKALMEEIEKAEHERAEAEVARDVAEENRELAESVRASSYADMQNNIQGAIDANTALYNRVEELADEGLITESRVIEIIEEQGGGGGGGTVVLPDNVLVASDVTAADVEAPKINADLFGSLPPSDYAKTTDVNAIKNGTTQVGNAKALDGVPLSDSGKRGVPLIVSDNGVMEIGSIIDFHTADGQDFKMRLVADNNSNRLVFYNDNGGVEYISFVSEIMPVMINGTVNTLFTPTEEGTWFVTCEDETFPYAYGLLEVRYGSYAGEFTATFKTTGVDNRLYYNTFTNGGWNGWRNQANTADLANYLPLTGGNLGNGSSGTPLRVIGKSDGTYIIFNDNTGDKAYLGINALGKLVMLESDFTTREILHTGNKPTGTYTGNGSAATRTINTGGIGNVCVIFEDDVANNDAIVTRYGAYVRHGSSVSALTRNDIAFYKGVLTIKSTDDSLNANGRLYTYQIL